MTAPRTPPVLGRRAFARAVLIAGGVAAGVPTLGACDDRDGQPEVDVLRRLADAAGRDASEFAAAGPAHGASASALHRLADVRRVHRDRLEAEIDRVGGPTTSTTTPAGPAGGDPAAVCPPVPEVRDRLRTDATIASDAAVASDGYRASLAAAVSAACTAAVEVVLA